MQEVQVVGVVLSVVTAAHQRPLQEAGPGMQEGVWSLLLTNSPSILENQEVLVGVVLGVVNANSGFRIAPPQPPAIFSKLL